MAKAVPRWLGYGIAVAGIHLAGLILLFTQARYSPGLLGMAFLAYTLGLRHAFDVDHIAAIDNTVRKLVQQKENPLGTGFYFSLGHSSVVFLMTIVTAVAVRWVQRELPQMQAIGGMIGTIVSGSFLLLIGILNLIIWIEIFRVFLQMRRGLLDSEGLEQLLLSRGFLARFFGPLFKFINKSWHVYPLGFLFGLGFDTASEVALLAVSAGAASQDIPLTAILSLPVLFAAGMSLMDTADAVFMTTAYRWAFATPLRKVYYNLTVTGLSVIAALLIGLFELAQVVANKIGLQGPVWAWLRDLEFSGIGYLLVLLFVLTWGISYTIWKLLRLEKN